EVPDPAFAMQEPPPDALVSHLCSLSFSNGSTSSGNERASRKDRRYSRWASHASHTFRRSSLWILGFRQAMPHTADSVHPDLEHTFGSWVSSPSTSIMRPRSRRDRHPKRS